jgi:hypothetical protein
LAGLTSKADVDNSHKREWRLERLKIDAQISVEGSAPKEDVGDVKDLKNQAKHQR